MISMRLSRDCDAVQIPSGAAVVLPKDTPADITQTLGGTFTVRTPMGLYKIQGKDADALGQEVPEEAAAAPVDPKAELDEKIVWDTLRTCFDPEIPVNIVDLGLVYDLFTEKLMSGGHKVQVKMTLTAPGCGMGPSIAADAQEKLLRLPAVAEAFVDIVWDPPWHQSMITAEGRKILGL